MYFVHCHGTSVKIIRNWFILLGFHTVKQFSLNLDSYGLWHTYLISSCVKQGGLIYVFFSFFLCWHLSLVDQQHFVINIHTNTNTNSLYLKKKKKKRLRLRIVIESRTARLDILVYIVLPK